MGQLPPSVSDGEDGEDGEHSTRKGGADDGCTTRQENYTKGGKKEEERRLHIGIGELEQNLEGSEAAGY